MQNVVFKFRRPSGSDPQQPSRALTEALHRLGVLRRCSLYSLKHGRAANPSPSRSFKAAMVNHYSSTSRRRQHEEY